MSQALKQELFIAGINTLLIMLVVILIGVILDSIKSQMLRITCAGLGNSIGEFLINRFTFIGVIHHELSHALMAIIFGAKVTEINIFRFSGDTLGNIKFVPRGPKILKALQMCFAALAPVICGVITLTLMIFFINMRLDVTGWWLVGLIYVEVSIFLHMTLSKVDIQAALKGMPVTLLLVFLVVYIFKIDFIEQLVRIFRDFISNIA